MLLTIIIPTYQRPNELVRCLKSIDIYDDIEIIISDNASDVDPSDLVPLEHKSHTSVHRHSENIGPRLNIYKAGMLARGEYVLYITDDDYFCPGQLKLFTSEIKSKRPQYGYAACYVCLEKTGVTKYYGLMPSFLGKAGQIYRSHILSGFFSRSIELKQCLQDRKTDLSETWYISKGLIGYSKGQVYMREMPLLLHTWENQTFWGISPDNSEILNADKLSLYKTLFQTNSISYRNYLMLLIFEINIFSFLLNVYFYARRIVFNRKTLLEI